MSAIMPVAAPALEQKEEEEISEAAAAAPADELAKEVGVPSQPAKPQKEHNVTDINNHDVENNTNSTSASASTSATTATKKILPKATNKVVKEFNSICEDESWHKIYHQIRLKADSYARENGFSKHASERNGRLNRYRDVHPYDHTRIVLKAGSNSYINANLVEIARAGCKYILTQGPLKETVADFWLMIWEQNSRGILMLNKLMEKGQVKCHKYWPSYKEKPLVFKFNDLKLSVELLRIEEYKNYEWRKFSLTEENSKESREIIQFHYTTWPDFGVPEQCGDFLIFWKAVHDSQAFSQTVGPAVVHCSAGIGRSGTFCLIDACLTIFENEGEDAVSVQDVLLEMRRARMGLIQAHEQLVFAYRAIIEGIDMLQDLNFLNHQETPISIDAGADYNENADADALNLEQEVMTCYTLDENPPPLPPRTHSLYPAPGVVTPELLNELIYINTANQKINDTLTFMRNEPMTQRPLPPLPPLPKHKQAKLERVHENMINENYDDDDDDDDNDDDDDDELMDEIDEDNDDSDDSDTDNGIEFNENENGFIKNYEDSDSSLYGFEKQTNGNKNMDPDEVNNSPTENLKTPTEVNNETDERELRRRKRVQRKENLEQLVQNIKRKQIESEADKSASIPKRIAASITNMTRGSLCVYLTAGFFMGALCVYAYTKMG